ncbi:uncharacterized protein LOC125686213 isoform X2 [Lagopus muta]|uniref:uncharacterized protein LOC125686213 isoform X2 n=1 Tax=Lagopus muta TaxID=64668 RepID=UPI00209FFD07|nr:uncharacterized protein LOC125686213 isoform X2 [Lagopus muta]
MGAVGGAWCPTFCQAEAELWGPLWDLICGAGFLRAHGERGAVGLLVHGAGMLVPAQRCGVFHAVGLPSLLSTLNAAVGLMEELRSVGQEELLPIEPPRSPTSVGREDPLMGREDPLMGLGEPLVGREALLVGLAQVVANSAPQCPLRPHSRRLLPHSGHRLLLGPTEDALTHKWQRRLSVSPRCLSLWFPLVAVGSAEGRVKLLEAGSGQEVQEVPATCGAVTAVGFISSDRIAVGGSGGRRGAVGPQGGQQAVGSCGAQRRRDGTAGPAGGAG